MNEEALELAGESGDIRGAAIVRGNIGGSLFLEGDDEAAAALLLDALVGLRSVGDIYGVAACLGNLARIALRSGDVDAAVADLRESLQLSSSIGDAHSMASTLVAAAAVALALGNAAVAARLGGAIEAACSTHGFGLDAMDRQLMDETALSARKTLGDAFEGASITGAELDLSAAVEVAVRALGG
jgi:hypothetical protein